MALLIATENVVLGPVPPEASCLREYGAIMSSPIDAILKHPAYVRARARVSVSVCPRVRVHLRVSGKGRVC